MLYATKHLSALEHPTLEAELLLSHALQKPRSTLLAWPQQTLTQLQQTQFVHILTRRQNGEPLAYITGYKEFWSMNLQVTPAVLIPRPETEILVEIALTHLAPNSTFKVLDMGTGSGAIALAIKKERPLSQIIATDISTAALAVARDNARHHQLPIEFLHGDLWEPVAGQYFNLILSNPPYVDKNDPCLNNNELRFEPITALAAAQQGLELLQKIITSAPDYLYNNAWLLLEHGLDQHQPLAIALTQRGFVDINHHNDYSGIKRCVSARWPG